jgi:hypothetical protein
MIPWNGFERMDVHPKDLSAPLTRYFDPAAYGLKELAKAS